MKLSIKTKKDKKWDFLFVSDSHFRHDVPLCYQESGVDFWEDVQMPVMRWLFQSKDKYNINRIIHAGDWFNKPKPPYDLLNQCIKMFSEYFPDGDSYKTLHCIAGNHDLPCHNYEQNDESAWGTLCSANLFSNDFSLYYSMFCGDCALFFVDYDCLDSMDEALEVARTNGLKNILVTHQYIWKGNVLPFPGCTYPNANDYLDMYPEFDVIVTGDNHQHFIVEKDGRLLINPGCMIRQKSSEMDYVPQGVLFNCQTMEYESVRIPYKYEHITRDHLEHDEQVESRKNAFVESLEKDVEVGLSFRDNLEQIINKSNVSKKTRTIIQKVLE